MVALKSKSHGARRSARADPFPGFVDPALATLRDSPPIGTEWVHEIKYDGYRAQAHLEDGTARVYTRAGYDWTDAFRSIADALTTLGLRSVILDGEVVSLDAHGVPDFSALQSAIARKSSEHLVFYAFDLLYQDGRDFRRLPLLDRKDALRSLLSGQVPPLLYSDHFEGNGQAMFEHACGMRLEGIVSKRGDAPYVSGRTDNWLKVKCTKEGAFPIVAFVEKLGAKPRRIASLYLGRWEGERLLYAGKARSGYSLDDARLVRERLDPLVIAKSPLSAPLTKPKATWVRPEVEAEVSYSSVTTEGLLREPVFKRLAAEPTAESPRAFQRRPAASLPVPKENILQLLPDAIVPSREELKAYWRSVARRALQHLGRRPLKLVRHVRGTTFYHMGPLPQIPEAVHQLKVRKREGGEGTRLWVDSLDGLLGLVDMGAVELHPWNATVDDIEAADRLVFDLDPGEGVGWELVIETAIAIRKRVKRDGFTSWPKLTGGNGLHVMVPLTSKLSHDEAHRYSRELAADVARDDPRYTISATAPRAGRLFIDYLRNGRGTTAVGAYSPRARAGFPIAAPVTWADLERGVGAASFSMGAPAKSR